MVPNELDRSSYTLMQPEGCDCNGLELLWHTI